MSHIAATGIVLLDELLCLDYQRAIPDEHGNPLVKVCWLDIQHVTQAGGSITARLLGEKAEWGDFIEQPQFPKRPLGISRIQKNPARQQIAMKVSHHGAYVAL